MKNNNIKSILTTLWIVLMLNMIFNDIFSIFIELNKFTRVELPGNVQTLMTIAALITNIPLMMILFSNILEYKINRLLNIFVAIFTVIYIWVGKSSYPHYIVVAIIETLIAILIIAIAWNWKNDKNDN